MTVIIILNIFVTKNFLLYLLTCLIIKEGLCGDEAPYYNVLNYGAKADGITSDLNAISKAIETAFTSGGGTVYFPDGEYLSAGPIHLKSNVTLNFSYGSVVRFSDNFDDYIPFVETRWGGTELTSFSPLIYANGAQNIGLTGEGQLDGSGKKWWDYHNMYVKNGTIIINETSLWQREYLRALNTTDFGNATFMRPQFVQFINSQNILIENIRLRNSPFWTINPVYSENVTIRGVNVENPVPSPNSDGIDSDSCKNVLITNCTISVDDDCIVVKSGKDEDGRRVGRAAENHVITNCTTHNGWGGIVIGSETSGGVRNISVSGMVFNGTKRGIRIKSTRGRGGIVSDVRISNISMTGIHMEGIILDLKLRPSEPEPFSDRTPVFRDIHISGVSGSAKRAVHLRGLVESPLTNITLTDINLIADDGVITEYVTDLTLQDVCVHRRKS